MLAVASTFSQAQAIDLGTAEKNDALTREMGEGGCAKDDNQQIPNKPSHGISIPLFLLVALVTAQDRP